MVIERLRDRASADRREDRIAHETYPSGKTGRGDEITEDGAAGMPDT